MGYWTVVSFHFYEYASMGKWSVSIMGYIEIRCYLGPTLHLKSIYISLIYGHLTNLSILIVMIAFIMSWLQAYGF